MSEHFEFDPRSSGPDADEFRAPPGADVVFGGSENRRGSGSAGRSIVAWSTVGLLGVGAVAAGLYLAGQSAPASPSVAALAAAATAPASPAPTTNAPGTKNGQRPLDGPRRGFAGGGPAVGGRLGVPGAVGGRVLHSEATVQTQNGTQIVDTQVGTISGIDTTNDTITVKSSDNVSFTYVVDSKTRIVVAPTPPAAGSTPAPSARPKPITQGSLSDLKSGDTVAVVANRSGDTRTATTVVDGQLASIFQRFGGPGGHGPWGDHPAKPSPKPTPTTSGASA